MARQTSESCVILISGPVRAGKTAVAQGLATKHGFTRLGTREAILRRLPGTLRTRGALQTAGEHLDALTNGTWVADELRQLIGTSHGRVRVVVDAVRTGQQIDASRLAVRQPVLHVHVTAAAQILRARYQLKHPSVSEVPDYDDVRSNATEARVGNLARTADLVIDTTAIPAAKAVGLVLDLIRRSIPTMGDK